MEYFNSALAREIVCAKRSGLFDIGIKNISGREVSFTGPPRTFHFLGDEKNVRFYNVACDTGITRDMAEQIYKDETLNIKTEPTTRRGETSKRITSGFFIDERPYLRRRPNSLGRKVFLIIFGGHVVDKSLVIRPNAGKRIQANRSVEDLLRNVRPCNNLNEALDLWEEEFNLADMPYEEIYQFSCRGRHKNTTVVCGSVVPLLQQMISILDKYGTETQSILSIVRVETGNKDVLTNNSINVCGVRNNCNDDHEKRYKEANQKPCIGDKMAKKIEDGIVLLGTIFGRNGSGDFLCKLTDGSEITMSQAMVSDARLCFQDQVSKLIKTGMTLSDAHHLDETIIIDRGDVSDRKPVLSGNNATEPEKNFEVEFTGKMPKTVVGIEVPNKEVRMLMNGETCLVSATKKLLHGIGSQSMKSGVKTTIELFSENHFEIGCSSKYMTVSK